jgi:hypothetical protein
VIVKGLLGQDHRVKDIFRGKMLEKILSIDETKHLNKWMPLLGQIILPRK